MEGNYLNRNSSSTTPQREDHSFGFEDQHSSWGTSWPARNYACSFCKREFRSAQALGGHMNVHRRDRARLRSSLSSWVSSDQCPKPNPTTTTTTTTTTSTTKPNNNNSNLLIPPSSDDEPLNYSHDPSPLLCSPCLTLSSSSASTSGDKKPRLTLTTPSHHQFSTLLSPQTREIKNTDDEELMKGFKSNEENITLELGIGLLKQQEEKLDLELRLGH